MINILKSVRKELKKASDQKTRASGQRFFKESVKILGVKTPLVEKIAREYFKKIKDQDKTVIFDWCEKLWQSGYIEESFIACSWIYALRQKFQKSDIKILENWLSRYVSNWASCDTFCNHSIAAFMEMYPQLIPTLFKWTQSTNRWMRRAAAVTLIIPARHGKFLKEIFAISDLLLTDPDDLVQKGYGWLLKAASEAHQKPVYDYVMKHKAVMPRTALRYAIEKMPPPLKKQAMSR